MEFMLHIGTRTYRFDPGAPLEIAIALRFDGGGLQLFGVPPAAAQAVQAIAAGDGCNCDTYIINPHCHATHTESAGHIEAAPRPIFGALRETLIPATLITITPESEGDDTVISRDALEQQMEKADPDFSAALIIRTLPNDPAKQTRNYDQFLPPYFSTAAMDYIHALGVRHLLTDLPSVDRLQDEGKLSAHHIFWQVPQGTHDTAAAPDRTITELIYVPDEIIDGPYLLNLQIAAFAADAAPSRPVLFEVTPT